MPNERWSTDTALIPRVAADPKGKGAAAFKRLDEFVFVPFSTLSELGVSAKNAAVLRGRDAPMRPLIGTSDDLLIDMADHKLVDEGIFVLRLKGQILVRRAARAEKIWIFGPDEVGGYVRSSLSGSDRVLARVRLTWKRL